MRIKKKKRNFFALLSNHLAHYSKALKDNYKLEFEGKKIT